MPNRMIRDSCRTSETLNRLSAEGERLFWRLTTVADDFGRFEADPRVLLAQCFPLKVGAMKVTAVAAWFSELLTCGLVQTYVVREKTLGFFVTWDKHQRVRAKHSKYPAPSSDNTCQQTTANVPESRETRVERRETRDEKKATALVVLTDDQFLDSLRANPAYQGIDLDRELAKMDAWLGTPNGRGRRKTRGFIVNWLNKIDRPVDESSRPVVPGEAVLRRFVERHEG